MKKEEKAEKNPVCEPCDSNFQEHVQSLVDNVDNYSEKDHEAKKREVTAAFGAKEKATTKKAASTTGKKAATTKKTTTKPVAKKPAAKKADMKREKVIEIEIIEVKKI